jgi:hypothetical protein
MKRSDQLDKVDHGHRIIRSRGAALDNKLYLAETSGGW